jgi:hypothetical protein
MIDFCRKDRRKLPDRRVNGERRVGDRRQDALSVLPDKGARDSLGSEIPQVGMERHDVREP